MAMSHLVLYKSLIRRAATILKALGENSMVKINVFDYEF
jgi:hypothetical protein